MPLTEPRAREGLYLQIYYCNALIILWFRFSKAFDGSSCEFILLNRVGTPRSDNSFCKSMWLLPVPKHFIDYYPAANVRTFARHFAHDISAIVAGYTMIYFMVIRFYGVRGVI